MQDFENWLRDKSFQEMAQGYRTDIQNIKKIIWLAIGEGLSSEAIASLINSGGGNIADRSVYRILSRYGLSRQTLAGVRQEAQRRSTLDSYSKTSPPISGANTKEVIWLAIGEGFPPNAIAELTNSDERSVASILDRCGLSKQMLASVHQESQRQSTLSQHGKTSFKQLADPYKKNQYPKPPVPIPVQQKAPVQPSAQPKTPMDLSKLVQKTYANPYTNQQDDFTNTNYVNQSPNPYIKRRVG